MDMDAKAVLPENRGVDKQKNLQGEARNRRVLKDIGNLVPDRAVVQGKPIIQRPVTRSFGVQLYANAQGAGEKNKKKFTEAVDGEANKEKVCEKAAQDSVIVISSDDEDKIKEVKARRVLKGGSSKKKSLTSILSARSKAACGLKKKPKDPVVDIDEADAGNELAVVEYIDDIYKFYKLAEDESRVHDYIDSQPEINAKMRMILFDWLVEVHRKFELMPETLYLTINIVDRYLAMKVVRKRELQLVGISAMLIASKYEEIWAPEVNDFVFISDNAYIREQVLVMEKAILERLEWYLTVPTPYVFLVRYTKASIPSDTEMENMVLFLAELGIMHYPTIILYCPSMFAASAVFAARCTLNKCPFWTETLKHHTGYTVDQLMDCAKQLVSYHTEAAESKVKAIYRKFSNPERSAVALYSPAKTLMEE